MKKILFTIVFLLFASSAMAADVCTYQSYKESSDGGQFTLKYSCVLDNSDTGYATFAAWDTYMSNFKGAITSIEGKQGATPNFPNALVVSLQTDNNVPLPNFPSASITGSAGAAAWILAPNTDSPITYMGNLKVLFTTNTTTGAIIELTIQGLVL